MYLCHLIFLFRIHIFHLNNFVMIASYICHMLLLFYFLELGNLHYNVLFLFLHHNFLHSHHLYKHFHFVLPFHFDMHLQLQLYISNILCLNHILSSLVMFRYYLFPTVFLHFYQILSMHPMYHYYMMNILNFLHIHSILEILYYLYFHLMLA